MSEFILYKAENIINGFSYIGATSDSISQRKLDHIERATRGESGKFHKAISTYGPEAFVWEQIDTASSTDELAQKEKEYIFDYNSQELGYNSDCGGGFKKTVYQYCCENEALLNTYSSLKDAANAVNANKQTISRACLSNTNFAKGFYWSYNYPLKTSPDGRLKAVDQIDEKGNVITSFKSIAEASRATGIYKGSIAKVCKGERKSAGGYYWKENVEFLNEGADEERK